MPEVAGVDFKYFITERRRIVSIIQVTPEMLCKEADRLLNLKKQQESEMNRLRLLVNTLDECWKGVAHDAFVNEFSTMQYSFRNFSLLLESYANLMKTSANQLQQTDKNMKKQIQNI